MSLSINELRILLVLMQAQLTETRGASTIAEAKTLIREWQPDIVTSAMYFEDGTAHQLIDFIHASNLEDTVHFMLVSSEHRPDQLEQFKQAGIVAILPKPFSSQQLQRAIRATVDLIEPESVELNLFDVEDLRVLLVDDSMTSLHALRRVFENMGVEHIVESNLSLIHI